jgi:hypothetical protein
VKGGSNQSEYHHFDLSIFLQGAGQGEIGEVVVASIMVCKYSLWVLI